jgi:hypothetical protein
MPRNRRERRASAAPERRAGQPWTVPELAAELRVSDQHLYNMIRAGRIATLKLDGVYRVADSVAQRLIGVEVTA